MNPSLAAFREWYWAGGPGRRFLVSIAITVLVLLPFVPSDPRLSAGLFAGFIGWDLGAWWMDRTYVHRLAGR